MTHYWTNDTERYRYATREDIPAFSTMLSDPEVNRWLWFAPIDADGVEAFFGPLLDQQSAQVQAGDRPHCAVFTVENLAGDFLGQGAVVPVEGSPDGIEIGFQLMRQAWRRGVGTRLGQFLCAYAIRCCNAYRIQGGCLAGNAGSAALMRKLGLQQEATMPGYRLRDGVRHTEWVFGREVEQLDTAGYLALATRLGL